MKDRYQRARERWERDRAAGKRAFVFRAGARFALTLFVLVNGYMLVLSPLLLDQSWAPSRRVLVVRLLITAVVYAISGWIFGAWLWRSNRKRFGH